MHSSVSPAPHSLHSAPAGRSSLSLEHLPHLITTAQDRTMPHHGQVHTLLASPEKGVCCFCSASLANHSTGPGWCHGLRKHKATQGETGTGLEGHIVFHTCQVLATQDPSKLVFSEPLNLKEFGRQEAAFLRSMMSSYTFIYIQIPLTFESQGWEGLESDPIIHP